MPMVRGIKTSFAAFGSAGRVAQGNAPRTEQDLPARWISLVTLVLVAILVATFAVFLRAEPVTAGSVAVLVTYSVAFAFIFGFLVRSEEHTSELQSLMRISYAVFCLKKKTKLSTTICIAPNTT